MTQLATFGAGCFWHVEEAFRELDGVVKTTVGYMGGTTKNPTYKDVCGHRTGHAEVCQVEFDPKKISFEKLLDIFWKCHDPTQHNRQGPDIGDQYRSAIFYHSEEQRKIAEKSLNEAQKRFGKPIVTQIANAATFYPAEKYHQQYLMKRGLKTCGI